MATIDTAVNNPNVIDSLHTVNNYLTQSDLTNLYKDFLSNQTSSYNTLFGVLIGMTTLLIGFSIVWNIVISRNQIKLAVKEETSMLAETLKTDFKLNIAEQLLKTEKDLDIKYKKNEANLARLYANSSNTSHLYLISVIWWITAIELYKEIEDERLLRICVDAMLSVLNNPDCFKNKEDFDFDNNIQKIKLSVPDILITEKDKIIKILEANNIKAPINIPKIN